MRHWYVEVLPFWGGDNAWNCFQIRDLWFWDCTWKCLLSLQTCLNLKTREIFRKPTFQTSNSMHSKRSSKKLTLCIVKEWHGIRQVSSSYMIARSSHLNFLNLSNSQNTSSLVLSQFYNSSKQGLGAYPDALTLFLGDGGFLWTHCRKKFKF